jgi:aconitate hydratase
MGPNIKPFPESNYLQEDMKASVILKTGDNITTDDIMPSNAKLLPFRSNIPKLANFAFATIVEDFKERAEKNDGGIVVGGENYGQGSSREHAALVPLYLGIKAVIAKSFARIHRDNLINVGIIPLTFIKKEDYEMIDENDVISIGNLKKDLTGDLVVSIDNKNIEIPVNFVGSEYDKKVLEAGGYLNYSVNNL